MIIRIFVLVVSFILIATALAHAQDGRPALRAEAVVSGGVVRIGDLVENAGIVANVAVFRAPALGEPETCRSARSSKRYAHTL